ncbi:MAG: DUF4128 domain-containing protein [Epibacterium sp.]|nr:DUF4128 domain-containing protein [Epibacterium sp.]NQX75743.1 hypothetical protein [Epibacterium sp.]
MASIYNDIRATLEVELSQIPGIPDIAYENVTYQPTTGTSFVKPKFVPVSREPAVRGINPQQLYKGVFRVSCFTPEGRGPAEADELANKIINAFDATKDISFSGTIVCIDYADRDSGFTDSPWYYVTVNIGWFIYA